MDHMSRYPTLAELTTLGWSVRQGSDTDMWYIYVTLYNKTYVVT